MRKNKKRIVIALGGNAIHDHGERGTYEEQMHNVQRTLGSMVDLLSDTDCETIITHGNGPQVGNIIIQNAAGKETVPEMPMFVCGAMSQGEIGFFFQQTLENLMAKRGKRRDIATIVTQVVVDGKDPAFKNPSKPVGPFYGEAEAKKLSEEKSFIFKEDSGRGWRRVVPSPEPQRIVEINLIRGLVSGGAVVIVSGGGGIPVVCRRGLCRGVDAVIDKDKAAALLADTLKADTLIILTAVERVSLNYKKPDERQLDAVSTKDVARYLAAGHFASGSMRPKMEAALSFIKKNPRRRVLITHSCVLGEALAGRNGTWIQAAVKHN